MRRLLLLLGMIAACGDDYEPTSDASPDAPVSLASIQIIGAPAFDLLSPTAQLAARATFTDGEMKDVTDEAKWVTTDSEVATVDAGHLTLVAPGMVTIAAELDGKRASLRVEVRPPTLAVANFDANSIVFFPATAAGNVAPTRSIAGAATRLDHPRGLTVVGDELFVANQGVLPQGSIGSISVFPTNGSGDITPIRQIAGPATGLDHPSDVIVFENELYVGQVSGNVLVFPLSASGDTPPTRTITFTGLTRCTGVKVFNREIYVTDPIGFNAGQLAIAPVTASGATTPTRLLTGPATGFSGTQQILIDDGKLFVANSYSNRVDVFDAATANGNIAPLHAITGVKSPYGMLVIGKELYISNRDSASVDVFPRTASGTAVPTRRLVGAATQLLTNLGLVAF